MAYDLYVITDETISGGRTHAEIARLAIAGGADAIQLRDEYCGCRRLLPAGREIAAMCRKQGVTFIVNDRLDVALACGADGVHLGQSDLRADVARQIAPPGFFIGVSIGNLEEALRAEKDGADYVALSPTFYTSSKSDAGPGHGIAALDTICARVSIPVIAIGGISTANVEEVIARGADGVAVISEVVARPDIIAVTRELKTLIARAKRGRTNRHE